MYLTKKFILLTVLSLARKLLKLKQVQEKYFFKLLSIEWKDCEL